MAVSIASLVTPVASSSSVSAGTMNTSNFSPTPGGVLFGLFYGRRTNSGTPNSDIDIGTSLAGAFSWNELIQGDTQSNRNTLGLFWSRTPATPGTGNLQFTYDQALNRRCWIVFEVLGIKLPVIQAKSGLSTSATPSLALDNALGSRAFKLAAACSLGESDGYDPSGDMTELAEIAASVTLASVQYALSPSNNTAAWTGMSTTSNILMNLEFQAEDDFLGDCVMAG